jgi:hypothetical protein
MGVRSLILGEDTIAGVLTTKGAFGSNQLASTLDDQIYGGS